MLQFDTAEEKKVEELKIQEAEELAQVLAQKYNLPYIDLTKFAINTDALRLIPEAEARAATIAAFKIVGRTLYLALLSPANSKVQAIIEDLKSKNFVPLLYLCSEASLRRAFERYVEISRAAYTKAGIIDVSNEAIAEFIGKIQSIADLRTLFAKESQEAMRAGGVSGLLEVMLAGSIATEASDIHVEPQEAQVRLRYRLDGVLHDIAFFNQRIYQRLLSRVKLISGLKLNIQRAAQDGRFSILLQDTEIEIRASILPGAYGESIVLRLLNPKTIGIPLEELGMEPFLLSVVGRELGKPNGMILLTGPTGSGKTTTLYAFLRKVSTESNKIITIEDPIEYHLVGINQTQVNPSKSYTFLTGLRSALRQDPDIIMVGEIRDKETAQTAIHASLTGHLVFSTLHTNNAAGTIPRLIDLGINPKIIDSALNIAMAQRLVRRLCSVCRIKSPPTPEEKKLLAEVAASIQKKRPGVVLPPATELWRSAAGGCDKCQYTGYKGRIGVFEAILMSPAVARLIVANPNERELRIAAQEQNILDMRQDGIVKVLEGITTLDELARVVDVYVEII